MVDNLIVVSARVLEDAKAKRKTYLKLKGREFRKRERAAADKLGITVAAYRASKAKGKT